MATRIARLLSVVLLSGVMFACPALGQGPLIASIEQIDHQDLYECRFVLPRDAAVEIDAVGSGWIEEKSIFAYSWILDLQRRVVVWQMSPQSAEPYGADQNIRETTLRELSAGSYALYFSAFGGSFPIRKKVTLLKLFDLGSIKIDGKFPVDWDEYGEPSEWYVRVRATDPNYPVAPLQSRDVEPDLGAAVRLARVGDTTYRCATLDVREAVRMRVLAIGEYAGTGRGFADGAWILDRDRCRRVWEMTLENTERAGGAEKNRRFDAEVTFRPGRYLACYGSDDSHAYDTWNGPPPHDPDSWGLTLIPVETLNADVVTVALDPQIENLIVRHAAVGDSAFRQEGFTLTDQAEVCIRGLGEKMHGEDRLVDFGWIEDADTRDVVWTMECELGSYAAGEVRNRLVEAQVSLAAGNYYVGYVTDENHSAAGWHDHGPFDPRGWGITVSGAGASFSMDWVQPLDPGALDRTVISLAPMRDNQRRDVSFAVDGPTRVRLIALGEGGRDEMYDYAWLTAGDSGRTVWEMRAEDTQHAGGAPKNRRIERILTLEPGRYTLGYRADDSHAFGSWNADMPREPYRWGVTLIELVE